MLLGLVTGIVAAIDANECANLQAAGFWVYGDRAACYAVVGTDANGAPLYMPIMLGYTPEVLPNP